MLRYFFFASVLLLALLSGPSVSCGAVAPTGPERVSNCAEQGMQEGQAQGPVCVVAGMVYCSEYGSRYSTPLMLVLKDGRGKHSGSISDTNGSFAVVVPCGGSFEASVEFEDKAMPVGRIELPASAEGTVFTLELRHTGSYLELVRDIREGVIEDDITYRLVGPEKRD